MSAPRIPKRQPIGDAFSGAILQNDEHYLLARAPLEHTTVVQSGSFVIRYGITYLGKPHLSIVPGLLALDYGEFLTGEEAWHFIFNKSNLYPRADVVGYRNDGLDDMVVMKNLDLMYPLDVLVYSDEQAPKPLVKISAIIADEDAILSEHITKYVPIFPSLTAWKRQ